MLNNMEVDPSRRALRYNNLHPADSSFLPTLDSSLDRTTAVIDKLKRFSEEERQLLLDDLLAVNLSQFVSEAASAICGAKLQPSDVQVAIQICSFLHQRYDTFSSILIKGLKNVLCPPTSREGLVTDRDSSVMLLFVELYLVGVLNDTNILLAIITELTKNENLRNLDSAQTNLSLLLAFAQQGRMFLGLPPSTGIDEEFFETDLIISANQKKTFRNVFRTFFESAVGALWAKHPLRSKMNEGNGISSSYDRFYNGILFLCTALDMPPLPNDPAALLYERRDKSLRLMPNIAQATAHVLPLKSISKGELRWNFYLAIANGTCNLCIELKNVSRGQCSVFVHSNIVVVCNGETKIKHLLKSFTEVDRKVDLVVYQIKDVRGDFSLTIDWQIINCIEGCIFPTFCRPYLTNLCDGYYFHDVGKILKGFLSEKYVTLLEMSKEGGIRIANEVPKVPVELISTYVYDRFFKEKNTESLIIMGLLHEVLKLLSTRPFGTIRVDDQFVVLNVLMLDPLDLLLETTAELKNVIEDEDLLGFETLFKFSFRAMDIICVEHIFRKIMAEAVAV